MQYRVQIEDQDTDIWTRGGTVEAVMARSNTEVWSEGGGGYVGPNGGYVSAPTVRSQTTHFKEVRFVSDAGQRSTYNVRGHVTVMPGDRVTFAYASHHAKKNGPMVGFINHTENYWWSFDSKEVLPYKANWALRGGIFFVLLVILFSNNFLVFLAGGVAALVGLAMTKAAFFKRVNEALQQQIAALCNGGDPQSVQSAAPPPLARAATMNLS